MALYAGLQMPAWVAMGRSGREPSAAPAPRLAAAILQRNISIRTQDPTQTPTHVATTALRYNKNFLFCRWRLQKRCTIMTDGSVPLLLRSTHRWEQHFDQFLFQIFIARQHSLACTARYRYTMVSVCRMCRNICAYRQTLSTIW